MPKNKQKILLEMSGGLDSSVAALLLIEQGYEVVGVMMKLWSSKAFEQDYETAKNISKQLDIRFHLIDLQDKFQNNVIKYFVDTYKKAKTPNPCIVCNKHMKFGQMFDYAKQLGCEKLATGHYAQIKYENNTYSLHRAKDLSKDQSYVLHFLDQDRLSKIIFPLGSYKKEEIRKIACNANFSCAEKEESMDICFTEGNAYQNFLTKYSDYKAKPGNVINLDGKILGTHNGLANYTIGQRKGLGLAFNEPMYVISLNYKNNEVVLGTKEETFQNEVIIKGFSWIKGTPPKDKFICEAKLRYRQQPHKCQAIIEKDFVRLTYKDGISAVTPGQFAVLYKEDKVLGGGIIS